METAYIEEVLWMWLEQDETPAAAERRDKAEKKNDGKAEPADDVEDLPAAEIERD